MICLLVVLFYWYAPQGTAIEPVQPSDLNVLKKQSLIRVCLLILCSLFVKEKIASVNSTVSYPRSDDTPLTKYLIEGSVFMKFGKKIIKMLLKKELQKLVMVWELSLD